MHDSTHCTLQGDTRLIVDDIKALQPTIFPTVPRLLNRMHDKVSAATAIMPNTTSSSMLY
jgi:long-subunit acyl-CoA synthetase (AMP-forming)